MTQLKQARQARELHRGTAFRDSNALGTLIHKDSAGELVARQIEILQTRERPQLRSRYCAGELVAG